MVARKLPFLEWQTFLSNFIKQELDKYQEPQKKGVKKGDKIGFQKKKYAACLLSMTNFKQNDVAKMLNISFGVVRSWHIQQEFKDTIQIQYDKFLLYLIDQLRIKIYAKPRSVNENEFFSDLLFSELTQSQLKDISYYNEDLIALIKSKGVTMQGDIEIQDISLTEHNDMFVIVILSALLIHIEHYWQSVIRGRPDLQSFKIIYNNIINHSLKILKEKTFTDDNIGYITDTLNFISKTIK